MQAVDAAGHGILRSTNIMQALHAIGQTSTQSRAAAMAFKAAPCTKIAKNPEFCRARPGRGLFGRLGGSPPSLETGHGHAHQAWVDVLFSRGVGE